MVQVSGEPSRALKNPVSRGLATDNLRDEDPRLVDFLLLHVGYCCLSSWCPLICYTSLTDFDSLVPKTYQWELDRNRYFIRLWDYYRCNTAYLHPAALKHPRMLAARVPSLKVTYLVPLRSTTPFRSIFHHRLCQNLSLTLK